MANSRHYQCVCAGTGNDANDGLSWVTPKASIEAGVNALNRGGAVFIAPGYYNPSSTIVCYDHSLIGVHTWANFIGDPYVDGVEIRHAFNGHLIEMRGSTRIDNVMLRQMGTGDVQYTGAAIYGIRDNAIPYYCDSFMIQNFIISGYGWEYGIKLDGTGNPADGPHAGGGIRKSFIRGGYIFGCSVAGLYYDRVLHHWISDVGLNPATSANTLTTCNIVIADASSRNIHMRGMDVTGNFTTAASASGGIHPCYFDGTITGNVTCASGSNYNSFEGLILGTFTNNGGAQNKYRNRFA